MIYAIFAEDEFEISSLFGIGILQAKPTKLRLEMLILLMALLYIRNNCSILSKQKYIFQKWYFCLKVRNSTH